MGDWGVSKGLSKLYGETGKRESSKQELAILGMVDNKRKADEKEDQLARQEQEAYFDKVSEFSASLLAPDRAKINEKSKLLARKIRENVQMYGGDMSKFMANGGGQVMRDYKSSLLNSDEAALYAGNKQNMDLIVKAQMSGKGGQINPTDLQNLQNYNKNKEGEITYTGLLNEIEMPNAKAYQMGQDIPAEDILMNESNYTKIYGNFVTTFPNLDAPTKDDLLNFVRQNYSGKGENWQALASARNTQARAAANRNAKSGKKDYENNAYHISGDIANAMAQTPKNLTAKEFNNNFYIDANNEFTAQGIDLANISQEDYTDYAVDYSLKEKGFLDFRGRDAVFSPLFQEEYSVRNAKRLYNGAELRFAVAALGAEADDERFNYVNNTISNWQPDRNTYTADGVRIDENLDTEAYNGTWKVDAVIYAGEAQTFNGGNKQDIMIMNVVDAGKIDAEKTKEWDKDVLNYVEGDEDNQGSKGSEIGMNTFMVMKNEKGDVMYQKVDMTDKGVVNQINTGMTKYDNYAPALLNSKILKENREKAASIARQSAEPINAFYDDVLSDEQLDISMKSELIGLSPDGNYNDSRQNLLTSFYTSLAIFGGKDNARETFSTEAGVSKFSTMLQDASSEAGVDYMTMLKEDKTTDMDFISMMLKNNEESAEFYNLWMANHQILSER